MIELPERLCNDLQIIAFHAFEISDNKRLLARDKLADLKLAGVPERMD